MSCNPHDTIEQHAIELVSSPGKEHLFVANCPSDIDSNRYSSTVITYEEAFDHSDTGVGLCLLLPKAYVLQKFIDICLNKDISVHFVSLVQAVPANLKLLHGYTTFSMIRFNMSALCKILELPFAPQITKRNTSLHARLNRMLNTAMFLGLDPVERWSMLFPELLLSDTRRSVSFRAFLQLTLLISEDPMDAIAYQIRLMSPHSLFKLPMIAWQTSSLLRRSFSQLLMPLGRMDLQSVRLSISFHGMTQNSKSIFRMESICQYWT